MKKIAILMMLVFCIFSAYSQKNKINSFEGIWKFVPPEKGYDSIYVIFKQNKSLNLFYWVDTKEASLPINSPYSYHGFWDTSCYGNENMCPKNIKDLKLIGRYIFFYDDLIIPKKDSNNIGYDNLGNLYKPTRRCNWAINEELPEGLPPTTLSLYFNMNPDIYKKIDVIPDYVLLSLKKNKGHWKRYLNFIDRKISMIKAIKSTIYKTPNIPTKMYLIRGNEVEVLEQKGNWLRIRYYGKKTIEGWVKKEDVE